MKKFFKIIHKLRHYLLIILLFVIVLTTFNALVVIKKTDLTILELILYTIFSVILVIIIDGLTASIIHHLPKKWFDYNKLYLRTYNWERKFFNFIKIKKWKDKIPEIGALTCDFGKDKINEINNPDYIYDFIIETGYAEIIHNLSCLLGFLLIIILPHKYWYFISLPIAIINVGFNILSALIQRYNRPKLVILYKRMNRNKPQ